MHKLNLKDSDVNLFTEEKDEEKHWGIKSILRHYSKKDRVKSVKWDISDIRDLIPMLQKERWNKWTSARDVEGLADLWIKKQEALA